MGHPQPAPPASKPVVVLGHGDVVELLPMRDCIEEMERALVALARGEVYQPLRTVVRAPGSNGLLSLMPTHRAAPVQAYALKAICVFPGNSARGLDPHQGAVLLFDGETGELLAVANASSITSIRTAAVSAVATRALARQEAQELAVLGAGRQARAHLEALALVREVGRARIWNRTPERALALVAELDGGLPFPLEIVPTVEEAVRGADIVVTATASPTPLLRREWLAPGAHVNAVGSSIPTARELDTATMVAGSLFVDRRESAENEAGDYRFPVEEGALGPDHIRAELGEVLAGKAAGRSSPEELTVFKSLGLALEDLAALEFVYRRALETGGGVRVDL